jgi:nucleoid DNA-binding protein
MNKAELIEKLSKDVSLTKADTERVLDAFIETVRSSVKKD